MLMFTFATLLACLSVVLAGETKMEKNLKNLPVISNSIVNLGHIDISLNVHPSPLDFSKKSLYDKSCPCHTNSKRPSSDPANLFSKILSSNGFFEFDMDPTSTMCCESNEHVHEDTIIVELAPKTAANTPNRNNNLMKFPNLVFDSILPKPRDFAFGPKPTDIFFFPTKNFKLNPEPSKISTDIKVVGDKKLNKNSKTFKYHPHKETTVKKDIPKQEKKHGEVNTIKESSTENTVTEATTIKTL